MKNRKKGTLRLSEKVLGLLAIIVLIGWAAGWSPEGGDEATSEVVSSTGLPWFGTFSIAGSVLVIVLIVMKFNSVEATFLPSSAQEKMLPCVSLLPVLGFLIKELNSFHSILTVGGSIALAYISATSYWRNYIPDFVTNPLGEDEEGEPEVKEKPKEEEEESEPKQERKKPEEEKAMEAEAKKEEKQGEVSGGS